MGFFSERLVMSYLVDVNFASREFEFTRKVGISLRKNSGRAENIPRQDEIRYEWLLIHPTKKPGKFKITSMRARYR